jgi:predicted phosphodiesterase
MARPQTVVAAVARAMLAKYPDWPSKTLARMLVEEEPVLFANVEKARDVVRMYRGQRGVHHRKHIRSNEHYRPAGNQRDGAEFFALPAPLPEGKPWKVIPITFRSALVIGDIHIPHHDLAAVEIALAHGEREKADCIILNGDLLDFYALSFWEKDPRLVDFADEIERGKLFLEALRGRFPRAQIWYKEGNHEERLVRYCWSRCPELFGVRDGAGREMLSLATLLDCDEYDVNVVDNRQPIRCGEHLHILHGHEFRAPFVNPVNPARGLYLRAKCNAICGDLHQTSQHTETGLTHTVSTWSHGALCDLHPRYSPLNKWNLGFSVVRLGKAGVWSVENKKIISGQVV